MAVAFAAQAVLSGALSIQAQAAAGLSILSKNDLNREQTPPPEGINTLTILQKTPLELQPSWPMSQPVMIAH